MNGAKIRLNLSTDITRKNFRGRQKNVDVERTTRQRSFILNKVILECTSGSRNLSAHFPEDDVRRRSFPQGAQKVLSSGVYALFCLSSLHVASPTDRTGGGGSALSKTFPRAAAAAAAAAAAVSVRGVFAKYNSAVGVGRGVRP